MTDLNIRKAVKEDIRKITDIYNYGVENGISTLDIHPKTYEDMEKWFNMHGSADHPLITAERNGIVLGYA